MKNMLYIFVTYCLVTQTTQVKILVVNNQQQNLTLDILVFSELFYNFAEQ